GISSRATQHWPLFFSRLAQQGRAYVVDINDTPTWIATERLADAQLLWPESSQLETLVLSTGAQRSGETRTLAGTEERPAQIITPRATAVTRLAQGWLQILGPTTSMYLAAL